MERWTSRPEIGQTEFSRRFSGKLMRNRNKDRLKNWDEFYSMEMWTLCGWRIWTRWWMITVFWLCPTETESDWKPIVNYCLKLLICNMLPPQQSLAVVWFISTKRTCNRKTTTSDGLRGIKKNSLKTRRKSQNCSLSSSKRWLRPRLTSSSEALIWKMKSKSRSNRWYLETKSTFSLNCAPYAIYCYQKTYKWLIQTT